MADVVISSNLKKVTERIDVGGNVVNPVTKQVIQTAEAPFVPTPEQISQIQTPRSQDSPKGDALGDRIQQMINDKVNKIVEQKVEEALKKLL